MCYHFRFFCGFGIIFGEKWALRLQKARLRGWGDNSKKEPRRVPLLITND